MARPQTALFWSILNDEDSIDAFQAIRQSKHIDDYFFKKSAFCEKHISNAKTLLPGQTMWMFIMWFVEIFGWVYP